MSDYISRADAIEAVAQQWLFEASVGNPYVNDDDIGEYRKLAEELFEDVPSADAEQGVGRYENAMQKLREMPRYLNGVKEKQITKISADAVQGEWKQTITWQPYCSNCEYVFGEDEEFSPFWKYCPMCGARMKGGAE